MLKGFKSKAVFVFVLVYIVSVGLTSMALAAVMPNTADFERGLTAEIDSESLGSGSGAASGSAAAELGDPALGRAEHAAVPAAQGRQEPCGQARPSIVIDAGHGGMDGGAVAADGTQEKDINLAIAKALADIASEYPLEVVMTRTDDSGLYTDDERSIREKKREDLQNRKKIMEGEGVLLGISIHLNSFPQDEKVFGAQVFYPPQNSKKTNVQIPSKTAEKSCASSKDFAEAVQKSLEINIDDGRERSAMMKEDILIFKNSKANMILAECGFLSNEREAELLKSAEYQRLIAQAIWDGCNEILYMKKTEKIKIIDSANTRK